MQKDSKKRPAAKPQGAKTAHLQRYRGKKGHTYSVSTSGVSFFLEHNTKLPTHKGVLSFLGGFGISIAQRLPNDKKNCTIGA